MSATGPQMVSLEEATWTMILSAVKKHTAPLHIRVIKAFMAGMYLSIGGTLLDVLTADAWFTTNAAGLLKILEGLVFPIGLLFIVLLQADLLTASFAVFTAATIKRKVPAWAFLLDWFIVTVGNLAGSLFWAGIIVHYGGIFTPEIAKGAASLADTKAYTPNFREIFIRGIGCNFCVCMAVMGAGLARDVVSKILVIYIPISAFVSMSQDHVVANMYIIPVGLFTNMTKITAGTYIWKSFIGAYLGNIVGGALFIIPLMICHATDETDPTNPNNFTNAALVAPKGNVNAEASSSRSDQQLRVNVRGSDAATTFGAVPDRTWTRDVEKGPTEV